MAEQIYVEVVTPEEAVLAEHVDEVVIPGSAGQMGVLPGHLPLLTSLDVGELIVHKDGKRRHFVIDQGYAEVLSDRVTILTESCDGVNTIDIEHARKAVEAAEVELAELEERGKKEELEKGLEQQYRDALRRKRIRLMLAQDHKDDK